MDVKLDAKTFKALSNKRRVEMLKLLAKRRHTQSEIASELELSVPTVKEHLSALKKANLVELHDEGRKWKYYSLTKEGKAILHPEELKIWIMLSVFVLSAVGAAYRFIFAPVEAGEVMMAKMATVEADAMAAAPAAQPVTVDGLALALAIIAFVALVLGLLLVYKQRKYLSSLGKKLTKKRGI